MLAQSAAPNDLPSFDAVSIKPHADEGMSSFGIEFRITPDGITFRGGTLDMLLLRAFAVPRDRLLNEPDWAKSTRLDFEAKVAPEDAPKLKPLTPQQRWAMMIPALQDRCQLKFHHETRELEVYALVVAKGGAKLKAANPADSANAPPLPPGVPPPPPVGPPPAGSARPNPSPMTISISSKGMFITGRAATTESIADMLSQQIGATVVDKTGLTGKYNYSLTWTPDAGSAQLMGLPLPGPPPGSGGESQEPAGPSIYTALQEQLGLKLETHKESVDVIVIDHVERPSAN
jgi:uncharacterized protein (TIGR03435 family)